MENLLQKQTVSVLQSVLYREEECAVNGDFVLPDYCSDIALLLKCTITPYIQNRQWSGDKLIIDGTATIRVLYSDEERISLREVEFNQPITCAVPVSEKDRDSFCRNAFATKYVNCRAISPRRIEVRAALYLHTYGTTVTSLEVGKVTDDTNMCVRTQEPLVTACATSCEKIISVGEIVNLPAERPKAEALLGGDCRPVIHECKLLNDKVIVKGSIHYHHLYTENIDGEDTACLDFTVPFSHIMDMDGAREGAPFAAYATVLSDTMRCVDGPQGPNSAVEASAKLLIQMQQYENKRLPLVLDAYHRRYPLEMEKRDVSVTAFCGQTCESATMPIRMELPAQPIEEIIDVWAHSVTLNAVCENNVAAFSGRMTVSMIVRAEDGCLSYYEKPEEFKMEYPCHGNQAKANATVTDLRYRCTDGKLELLVSLFVTIDHFEQQAVATVVQASADSNQAYPVERASVKLYYADAGENVWDIGRCCHSAPEIIRKENDLTADEIKQPIMLTIPLC